MEHRSYQIGVHLIAYMTFGVTWCDVGLFTPTRSVQNILHYVFNVHNSPSVEKAGEFDQSDLCIDMSLCEHRNDSTAIYCRYQVDLIPSHVLRNFIHVLARMVRWVALHDRYKIIYGSA